jgi:hypothetical protein
MICCIPALYLLSCPEYLIFFVMPPNLFFLEITTSVSAKAAVLMHKKNIIVRYAILFTLTPFKIPKPLTW